MSSLLPLLVLLPGVALAVTAPCSFDGAQSAMGPVSAAAVGMLNSVAYVFPGEPCKGDKEVFPCHYSCDTTQGSGAQWKVVTDDSERNITQSITWVAPASASGTLPNGTEVLFMVGGGTEQKPCSPLNPDPKVCKGFKPLVAFNLIQMLCR